MMGLPDGRKSFNIDLVVLIQYSTSEFPKSRSRCQISRGVNRSRGANRVNKSAISNADEQMQALSASISVSRYKL